MAKPNFPHPTLEEIEQHELEMFYEDADTHNKEVNNMEEQETQEELNIGIGTVEAEKELLKPAKVKIVNSRVISVPGIKTKKVQFEVKHPDREETFNISAVSYGKGKDWKVSGTWLTLDKEGKIQKGSALATLLQKLQVSTIGEAIGKEVETEHDSKNYLCFMA